MKANLSYTIINPYTNNEMTGGATCYESADYDDFFGDLVHMLESEDVVKVFIKFGDVSYCVESFDEIFVHYITLLEEIIKFKKG